MSGGASKGAAEERRQLIISSTARLPLSPPVRARAAMIPRRAGLVGTRNTRSPSGSRLEVWGFEKLGLVTELITNAIRYGSQPIMVRVLRDRTLAWKVPDGSSTSPRLRCAATRTRAGEDSRRPVRRTLARRLHREWGGHLGRTAPECAQPQFLMPKL
ncbi:hypothetical protein [Streptomyces sp. NPDC048248]|uniref:hypothetical protein n=1 Tax=Streptomyces sp. NPDC048248 TaxID=3365523 RepID=UPI003718F2DE